MKAMENNPLGITESEIVVGIPSLNEADTIPFTVRQVDDGLEKYYPDRQKVIVNCDNASPDGTSKAFMEAATKTPKMYLSTPEGVTGKGNNLFLLVEKAVELSARAVVVVDADLTNIGPQWIRNLCEPILSEGAHYVAPLYARHKHEGVVTNNLAYPLTRALYGRRVRQPVGGDFGFSGEMAHLFTEEGHTWTEETSQFGIDMWMTTVAMRSRLKVMQSFMGRPKLHRLYDPAADLGPAFGDVAGTMFHLMTVYDDYWRQVKWSRPTAVFGFGMEETEVPPDVHVDVDHLSHGFRSGLREWSDVNRAILKPETFDKLMEVAEMSDHDFEFPAGQWARVVYDFAWAYNQQKIPRDDFFHALGPLFLGKTLSFVLETKHMNTQQVEEFIEDQCLQFEKTKSYLVERWFGNR